MLNAMILAECVEHQGRFLDRIIDGLMLLCEESGRQLPAHNAQVRGGKRAALADVASPTIDPFAAETGAQLAVAAAMAEELPARFVAEPKSLRHPGMVMMHTPGNVVALSSGQQNWEMRAGAEKYAKFAYSSRYAFSIEVNERGYGSAVFDGALG